MEEFGWIVVYGAVLRTWCSCFGFGWSGLGRLGSWCCYGGIGMRIGCCCGEKKSCSTFDFDCFLVHYRRRTMRLESISKSQLLS
ncbi:hypothetical protein AHAS_Ahas13G0304400 [Arachis hypogaea]